MAERDPDLQAFYDAADRVGPVGVRALIDVVQELRRSARNACNEVQAVQSNLEMVSNVGILRAKIDLINQQLAQWQWALDLDIIDVSDFLER